MSSRCVVSHFNTAFAKSRLALAVRAVLLGFVPVAAGLGVGNVAVAAEQQVVRDYAIPAGNLSQVLSRFAGEVGVPLSVDARLTDGKSSPGLQGRYSVEAGFAAVLSGTGLEAVQQGGSYSLRKLPMGGAVLPKVKISADAHDTATGPVMGYRAARTLTASKTDTPIRDIPQTINVVTRDEMRDRGVTKINDVFNTVPGAHAGTGYGGLANGYGTFLRGFSSDVDYRDGFRDAGFVSPRDIGLFERIEILKGPASVLYGNNEPGGAINYVSKRPTFESVHEVTLSAGSYDARRLEVDLTDPLDANQQFAYRVVAVYDERDSHRDYVSSDTKILAPSFTWRVAESTQLTVLAELLRYDFTFERGLPANEIAFDLPRERFLEEPDLNYAETESNRYTLEFSHSFNTDWSLRAAASYLKPEIEKLGFNSRGLIDDRTLRRGTGYSEEFQRDRAVQLELTGRFATGGIDHVLMSGVENYRSNFHYTFGPYSMTSTIDIYDPQYGQVVLPPDLFSTVALGTNYGSRTTAVYVQDQLTLNSQWKAMIGARYDRVHLFRDNLVNPTVSIEEETQSKVSPRAGLVFEPVTTTALFAGYSTSFNPQIFEMQRDGDLAKPQEGRQLEIGWREDWLDASLQSTLSVFHLKKKNVTTADPLDPDFSIQVGEQRSRGVELELRGRLNRELEAIFAGAFIDADVTRDNTLPEGDQLNGVPRLTSSVWLKYQPEARGWFGGGGVFYTGRREVSLPNDEVEFPDETRVDALAGYEAGAWRAQLNVRNITDEDIYVPYGNLFLPGAGRNADLAVTFNF